MTPALLLAAAMATASPADTFQAVCASRAVKSAALLAACQSGQPPKVLKDGSRFAAVGIGAEINTLAANLHLIEGVAK